MTHCRTRPLRVAAIMTAVTTLLVGVAVVPASYAAQPPASNQGAAELAQLRESVDYLTSQYAITEAEALRRLRLQRRAPELIETVRQQVGAELNAVWLDQKGGGQLVFASTREEEVRRALGSGLASSEIRVQKSRATVAEFERVAGRLRTEFGAGSDVRVSVSYERDAIVIERDGLRAGDVDARARAAAGARADLLTFENRMPPPANLAGEARACTIVVCDTPPMRGGLRLDIKRDDGSFGACTAGFNAKDSTGMIYVLTAGHCVLGSALATSTYAYHNGLPAVRETGSGAGMSTYAENTTGSVTESWYDYSFLPYQVTGNTNWVGYWISNRSNRNLVRSQCAAPHARPGCVSRDFSITGIYTWEQIGHGWVVCATGSGTEDVYPNYDGNAPGTHCGEIKDKYMYNYWFSDSTSGGWGLKVNICSRKGDSGGPLFSQVDNRAYGILSGGPSRSGNACDLNHPEEYGVYLPVSKMLQRMKDRNGRTYSLITSATG